MGSTLIKTLRNKVVKFLLFSEQRCCKQPIFLSLAVVIGDVIKDFKNWKMGVLKSCCPYFKQSTVDASVLMLSFSFVGYPSSNDAFPLSNFNFLLYNVPCLYSFPMSVHCRFSIIQFWFCIVQWQFFIVQDQCGLSIV